MNSTTCHFNLRSTQKIFFIIPLVFTFLLFSASNATAQSETVNISAKIKKNINSASPVVIHNETGKFKLFATYKNGKMDDMYAIDNAGKRIEVEYRSAASGGTTITCQVCLLFGSKVVCYEVDCKDIPEKKHIIAM